MSNSPQTYRVRGKGVSGGEASIELGNQVMPIDSTWGSDRPSGAPGPAELLAAAFTACLLKNLERSRAILKFNYVSADIDVQARRQDRPPKFVEIEYDIRIVTDESERRIDLLHRNLSQYGTVYNTLAAVCNVHGTIVSVSAEPVTR
ncbi:OsmC family protein [Parafrigoribacterium soli]|uniref:OsmC family protein n=1 Tax=Parafrigoribacterium soli TaxID=3144663 RepID=UPI0032EC650C